MAEPETMRETYRGFVNTWECDENDHLNVQGYVQRFELAARHFFAALGERWDAHQLRVRHIRYHRECTAGDLVRADSAVCRDADAQIVHMLYNADTDALLATAIDTMTTIAIAPASAPRIALPSEAAPRGLSPEFDSEARDEKALLGLGYGLTYSGIVRAHHCGPEGVMDDQHFIARVTDAVAHAWSRAGFTRAFLDERQTGRVAVEMKLSIDSRPEPGRLLHLVTGLKAVNRSTLVFRHVFVDSETRRPFATTSVAALIMDLRTRRATRFTDAMRQRAERILANG